MKLLFIDDEVYNLDLYQNIFKDSDFQFLSCNNLEDASRQIEIYHPDIILLDLKFGKKSSDTGLSFLKTVKKNNPIIEIIVISGSSSNLTKTQALIEFQAFDYIEKPVRSQHLKIIVERASEKVKLIQENKALNQTAKFNKYGIIGRHPKMLAVINFVEKVSKVNSPVLIEGETGTGKEVAARAIHTASRRKNFLAIDCGTLTENLFESRLFGHKKGAFTSAETDQIGLFEVVGDGTLFIDEVENLSTENQQKLLRCIEERKFLPLGEKTYRPLNARLIFGSNKSLIDLVNKDLFRADLYHRINVLTITLPTLKERKSDIPLLLDHFNDQLSEVLAISKIIHKDVYEHLKSMPFKGNVRELKNMIERALILGNNDNLILKSDFSMNQTDYIPNNFPEIVPLKIAEIEAKKTCIQNALKHTSNNLLETALLLKVSPRHLKRLMNEFEISLSSI